MYYNRIGDSLLILGSVLFIKEYNCTNFNIGLLQSFHIDFITICFILAAIAKSAQFLFHPWLASSMEGPTPVSALLHAATMVTAGVYLLLKIKDIYILSSNSIQEVLLYYSLITIIFSGLCSFFNNDIKKIIAYSTSAQLAYMFIAFNININSMFHLLTHGFFKALLFILAGYIIHFIKDNQDLRKYGNFISFLPSFYCFFLIGTLTITTLPFLSSFYSKEIILESLYVLNSGQYILSLIGAFLTILYSFKLLNLVFFKQSNLNLSTYLNIHTNCPSPFFLLPLLLGSIFLGYFMKQLFFVETSNLDYEFIPIYIKILPLSLFLGIYIINMTNKKLIQYLNSQLFIDSLVNTIFVKTYSFFSYNIYFKLIDRGLLESLPFYSFFYSYSLSYLPHITNTHKTSLKDGIYTYQNYLIFFTLSFFCSLASLFFFSL